MTAPRFFVMPEPAMLEVGQMLALPEAVAHHALRVVRLAIGDALTLFTGEGGEFSAMLVAADRRGATVRIDAFDPVERESPAVVTLAQAIAANDAMDYALRKATELGAAAIQPLVTARSAPLPAGERGERRHAHWRQVAIAACEQCGRNRVPAIHAVQPLAEWLRDWRAGGVLFAPGATAALPTLTAPPAAVLIGPEGGFTAAEIIAAERAGWVTARLGPRVLRTETAGTAALAAINVLWGDWR